MEFGVTMFDNGWHAIRGDSGVAISAAMSGVMSSIFIINLNLKTLKRRKYATENIKRCADLQKKLETLQTRAFYCIVSISSESLESIQLEFGDA
jgi:formiminotetrahydrofolate cyclodeaminase